MPHFQCPVLRTAVTNVGINGSTGGATRSDALRIDPPVAINISPNTVPGGMAINGVIQLNGTAPAKPDSVQRHHADVPEHRIQRVRLFSSGTPQRSVMIVVTINPGG